MQKLLHITLSFILTLPIIVNAEAQITDRLETALNTAHLSDNSVRTLVFLSDQYDIQRLDAQLYAENALPTDRARSVIHALKSKAATSQSEISDFLKNYASTELISVQQFWIANMLMIEAKPDVIYAISERSDVAFMDLDAQLLLDEPIDEIPASMAPNSSEPGHRAINAHKMWELGYTGNGRLVMGIDTGVNGTHPALSWKWRGNSVPAEQAWFDPETNSTSPNDCDSHGSHTVGTMCGLDPATNDTIGVAPSAEWIAAKTICSGNHTSRSIAAFEWAMDPDGDSTTIADMPDAIGNSWWDPAVNVCSPVYAAAFDAVEASGIALIFSAGNSGPGGSSITTPKNINTGLVNAFATGAVDGNNPLLPIASFSSRGPSQCGGTGSIEIKPEASAPGVSVRSAVLGSGYGTKSGTSMAAPHVVGAIALLKEAFPNKTGYELKMALYLTAFESPSDNQPGEDNIFGNGVIDVYEAFLSLGAPEAPVSFRAYSDHKTPTEMMLSWEDPTTFTNGDTLVQDKFSIHIYRDGTWVDSLEGGVETYVDNGLTDGQAYAYTVIAKSDSGKIESSGAFASWTAGGAQQPNPPLLFTVGGSDTETVFSWLNPSQNIDGTPLDDFAGIKLYRDAQLVETFTRATNDTLKADSVIYNPNPSGFYEWQISAVDNEAGAYESVLSSTIGTPLSIPLMDDFNTAGTPASGVWIANTSDVNDRSQNPPSGGLALNLNGTPNGEDIVEMKPLNVTTTSNTTVSYAYQPQGTGNKPEEEDSLQVYFKNDLDEWILVRSYPGEAVKPFETEVIDLATEPAGNGTFLHTQFQLRFRSIGGAGPFPNDDWFIDDIIIGNLTVGIEDFSELPTAYKLVSNYPNPFNPSTTITFQLPQRSDVSLIIYNALGQFVREVVSEVRNGGTYNVVWDGKNARGENVASGIYLYRFVAKSQNTKDVFQQTQKMILMK